MDISVLRDEFNSLKVKADEVLKKAIDEKRDLNDHEKKTSDEAFARMSVIKGIDERNAKFAEHAFKSGDTVNVVKPIEVPKVEEFSANDIHVGEANDFLKTPAGKKKFAAVVNEWAKTGLDARKKFAVTGATISSTTAGGIMFPKDVLDIIAPSAQNTFRQALAAVGMSPLVTATTREITYPVVLPTAGSVVAENAVVETEQPPTVGPGIDLNPKIYQSGSTWVSEKEIQALDFDLISEMIPALYYGKELAFELDGMNQIANDTGITNVVAAASDAGVTYANFVALNRALPKYYNANKVIVVSKAVLTAMENLVSTTGQPILTFNDPQNLSVRYFNGTPVVYTDYLNGFGTAGNVVGFVVSMSGFKLRDAGDQTLQRYMSYPERPGQQGFNNIGFHCIGYDTHAIAVLKLP